MNCLQKIVGEEMEGVRGTQTPLWQLVHPSPYSNEKTYKKGLEIPDISYVFAMVPLICFYYLLQAFPRFLSTRFFITAISDHRGGRCALDDPI